MCVSGCAVLTEPCSARDDGSRPREKYCARFGDSRKLGRKCIKGGAWWRSGGLKQLLPYFVLTHDHLDRSQPQRLFLNHFKSSACIRYSKMTPTITLYDFPSTPSSHLKGANWNPNVFKARCALLFRYLNSNLTLTLSGTNSIAHAHPNSSVTLATTTESRLRTRVSPTTSSSSSTAKSSPSSCLWAVSRPARSLTGATSSPCLVCSSHFIPFSLS